jgi:hypothetical protein
MQYVPSKGAPPPPVPDTGPSPPLRAQKGQHEEARRRGPLVRYTGRAASGGVEVAGFYGITPGLLSRR